jgi:S-adenosylmethionine decarboxylase
LSNGLREFGAAYRGPTGRFGLHLTLDGYRGAPARLGDLELVRAWLDRLPEVLGMRKLIEPCLVEVGPQGEKDPGGITGFVLIAQSHLSVHTFPRRRFVSADIFTCQDDLDEEGVRQSLIATFELGDVESHLIPRGTRYPLANLDDDLLGAALGMAWGTQEDKR